MCELCVAAGGAGHSRREPCTPTCPRDTPPHSRHSLTLHNRAHILQLVGCQPKHRHLAISGQDLQQQQQQQQSQEGGRAGGGRGERGGGGEVRARRGATPATARGMGCKSRGRTCWLVFTTWPERNWVTNGSCSTSIATPSSSPHGCCACALAAPAPAPGQNSGALVLRLPPLPPVEACWEPRRLLEPPGTNEGAVGLRLPPGLLPPLATPPLLLRGGSTTSTGCVCAAALAAGGEVAASAASFTTNGARGEVSSATSAAAAAAAAPAADVEGSSPLAAAAAAPSLCAWN